jgi:hypothetical protein
MNGRAAVIVDEGDDETLPGIAEEWLPIAPGVWRWRLPELQPVRNIITGRRNNRVGAPYSHKMNGHIAQESDNEGHLSERFEVSYPVEAYYGQPEKIKIDVGSEKPMIYTPDFLAVIAGHEVCFEFKLLRAIRPPAPTDENDEEGIHFFEEAKKLRKRLRLIRQAYRDANFPWILVTELHVRAMALEGTVGDIIANGGREIAEDDLGRLFAGLAASPGRALPLGQAESLIKESDFARGTVLARIPERMVRLDLQAPIDSDTLIVLADHLGQPARPSIDAARNLPK